MAKTFTTGVLNAANAAALGQALANQIRDDLVADPAWELVEEYVPATVMHWYVFRCLGAQSGLFADYYVVMGRTLATGSLRFAICEDYNSTTHVMSKFSANSTTAHAYDAQGRHQGTFTLATSQFASTGGQPKYIEFLPSGTSLKWSMIVEEDAFVGLFNGATDGFVDIGTYVPLSDPPSAMPILHQGGASTQGGVTRNPAVAGITPTQPDVMTVLAGGSSGSPSGVPYGFRGSLTYGDKLQGNAKMVCPWAVTMSSSAAGWEESYGELLGYTKRMRVGETPPAGFAWGDAYVLNGSLWVPYLETDPRIWDTGVPV